MSVYPADHRVPAAPGNRPGQRRHHRQRPARRDPPLFRYAALRAPEHAAQISRILAIPPKRSDRAIVCFLDAEQIDALLAAPGRDSWLGRRESALLLVAVQTGLRVSELTGLTAGDVHLGPGPHVRCHGKGRKDRATPLTRQTTTVLRTRLAERGGTPADPLFPARTGRRLSRDAVEHLVAKHATAAAARCPAIADKNVTPHTLRHSAATALPVYTQAWTPQSSRYGWATRIPPPPRPTSTPT